jgi:hypothetical protein
MADKIGDDIAMLKNFHGGN